MNWALSNKKKKDMLKKKLYLFDQDGTIYIDFKLLSGFTEFLEYIENKGSKAVFISNNSSRSTNTYKEKLSEILGKEISEEQVYVSTLITLQYLKEKGITKVYTLGTPDFEKELEGAGFKLTREDPQLIVVAFDQTLTYEKLKTACLLIRSGVPYIATHPDKVCPTKEGYIPDTGSFIALIEEATDKKPERILGKPNPSMVHFLLKKFALKPDDAIIFGDRLYTDIHMGEDSGITSALMLTGESKIEDIEKSGVTPDFVFSNWDEVLDLLK